MNVWNNNKKKKKINRLIINKNWIELKGHLNDRYLSDSRDKSIFWFHCNYLRLVIDLATKANELILTNKICTNRDKINNLQVFYYKTRRNLC